MNTDIEKALDRIVHESPYNGPIVAQAYRDLLAGAKLFGVPTSHYHRFLSQIEQECAESGKIVLKSVADAQQRADEAVSRILQLEAKLRDFWNEAQRVSAECGSRDHTAVAFAIRAGHTFDASCPCGPTVNGDEVRHR